MNEPKLKSVAFYVWEQYAPKVNAISTIKVFFSLRNLLAHAMDKAWAKPQEIAVKMIFLDNSCGFGNLICIVPTWPPKNSKTAKNFEN